MRAVVPSTAKAAARIGFGVASGLALACLLLGACGETRRPLGDECLRDDDCLSSVCSGRVCVATPPTTGDQLGPPDRGAKLPDSSANLTPQPGDAGGG